MKIAVLSGKGGTGKTFVSVNLSVNIPNSVYVDCDVEEPNGRLFLKPDNVIEKEVFTPVPSFDREKCTGCRKCVDFCKFNALVFIRETPKVFSDICHACGGCETVCPEKAITEINRPVGFVQAGKRNDITVITGILNLGEASAVPVIKEALHTVPEKAENVIIDCPPGSSCSVSESVKDADYCIIVTEPTAFGFHNFKMVHTLLCLLNKPCGVVVNKWEKDFNPLSEYCKETRLPILEKIPLDKEIGNAVSKGEIISDKISGITPLYKSILEKIGGR